MLLGLVAVLAFLAFAFAVWYRAALEAASEGPAAAASPPPSTQWAEAVIPNEAEIVADAVRIVEQMQLADASRLGGPVRRAMHAKCHAAMLAELRVLEGIPEQARAGIFREARSYRAWVRFSSGKMTPDNKPDARGIGVKVLGAPGPLLDGSVTGGPTQDFLLTDSPTNFSHDISQYLEIQKAAMQGPKGVLSIAQRYGLSELARILTYLATNVIPPMKSLAATTWWTGSPIALGRYAAKLSLRPQGPVEAAYHLLGPADFLRRDLVERLRRADVRFDLAVQFFVDETRTPINDGTIVWKGASSAPVKVAELILSRRDLESPRGRAEEAFGDSLSFTPWHGSQELRPLGGIMRVRRAVYAASARGRGYRPEPDGTETFG